MEHSTDYALCLLLTLGIEVCVAFGSVRALLPRTSRTESSFAVLAINLLTHPLAWLAVQHDWLSFVEVEVLVTLTESLLLAVLVTSQLHKAFLLGVLINAATIVSAFLLWIAYPIG